MPDKPQYVYICEKLIHDEWLPFGYTLDEKEAQRWVFEDENNRLYDYRELGLE